MDTRFWGPYGWNLLHTIPECLPEEFDIGVARKVDAFYRECFGALPCVQCRRSAKGYRVRLGGMAGMRRREDVARQVQDFHHLVNEKLRGQGLSTVAEDPAFSDVRRKQGAVVRDVVMGSGRVPGALFVLSIFENALRDARRSLCMRARRMIVALVDLMEDEGVGKGEVVAGMGLKECVSGRIVNTRQVRNCLVEKWGAWADCSGGVKSGEEAVRVIRLHFAKCKRKTCRGRVSRREIRNTHRRTHKSSAS